MVPKSNKENSISSVDPAAPADIPAWAGASALRRISTRSQTSLSAASTKKGPSSSPLTITVAATSKSSLKRGLCEVPDNACMDQFVDKTKRAIKRGCAEIGIRKYASLSSMSAKHAKTAGAAPAEPAATNTSAKPTADSAFAFASVLTASQPLAAESTATQTTHAARKPSGSLRKYPAFDTREASSQELSSEATVILLHSDYTVQEDDEDEEEEEEKGDVSIGISTANTSIYKGFTAGASVLESQMTIIAPSSPIHLPALVEGEETFETKESQFSIKALQPVVITKYTDLSETFTELAELLFSIEGKYN
ncbi:hypothetical protein GGF37_006254, partial [Kickxella alabastrina]